MDLLYVSKIAQVIASILIVAFVLVQGKDGGLSGTFGGSITQYRSKRGIERTILIATIVLGVFLIVNSLIIVAVS